MDNIYAIRDERILIVGETISTEDVNQHYINYYDSKEKAVFEFEKFLNELRIDSYTVIVDVVENVDEDAPQSKIISTVRYLTEEKNGMWHPYVALIEKIEVL